MKRKETVGFGVAALAVAISVAFGYQLLLNPSNTTERPVFSFETPSAEVVELGSTWRDPSLESKVQRVAQAKEELGAPIADQVAEGAQTAASGLPRTGRSVYETFRVNPGRVAARDLVRNVVLNPLDVSPSEASLASFLDYYDKELALVKEARDLLQAGRCQLADELVSRGQIPAVSLATVSQHSFRLKSGSLVAGDRLLRMVRNAMGEGANDQSVAASALTMAGVFGEGDTMHFVGGNMHLVPFARVEEGIPELLSIERGVTMEFVANIHYWFVALGALPSADELLGKAVARIMEGRR